MCICTPLKWAIKETGFLCTEEGFAEGPSRATSKKALTYKLAIIFPHIGPEMSITEYTVDLKYLF